MTLHLSRCFLCHDICWLPEIDYRRHMVNHLMLHQVPYGKS